MVKYQFEIETEKWESWKNTVPRSKSLEERIIELIEADTEGRVVEEESEDSETVPAPVEDALDQLELSSPERAAVRASWGHLRENGTSQRSKFVEDVYPDHHANYADRDLKNPERSWWKNVVDPNLRKLPGVEPPSKEGGHQWTYTGDTDGR